MSIDPVNSSHSLIYPQPLQSGSLRTAQNAFSTMSSIESLAPKNWFFSFFSKIFQWIKKIFPCLDTSPTTRRVLTAQELQERIQKGRDFINNNIDYHLGNSARNLYRDKFLVVMSYNNATVVTFPTSHPIDLNQLKRNALTKFEAMMRQPSNWECLNDNNLMVDTYYFARQIRPSDGALSPFIVSCPIPLRKESHRSSVFGVL
jgi:hypothetical protein